MKLHHSLYLALCAAAITAGPALAADGVMKSPDGVLVNQAGMTVYTFDKDVPNSGASMCKDQCAAAWPAVPAPASVSAPYSVVTRDDGSKQLAYNGKPLYLFVKDVKAGDRHGDDVKQVWHVVKE